MNTLSPKIIQVNEICSNCGERNHTARYCPEIRNKPDFKLPDISKEYFSHEEKIKIVLTRNSIEFRR